jgi:hypothetical protein
MPPRCLNAPCPEKIAYAFPHPPPAEQQRIGHLLSKHPVKDAVERVVPVLTRLEPLFQACAISKAAAHRYGWPDNRIRPAKAALLRQ